MPTNFLPKPPKAAKKQRPKRNLVAFETPDDVRAYLADLKQVGYTNTETCITALKMMRDAELEMGAAFRTVQTTAAQQKISLGKLLGQLALRGFEKSHKK